MSSDESVEDLLHETSTEEILEITGETKQTESQLTASEGNAAETVT